MREIALNSARALCAGLLALIGACSSPSTGDTSYSAAAHTFPDGIAVFKNPTAAIRAGIYPGDGKNCCFLGPRANLILNKPPGTTAATFSFYVPKVARYASGEAVTLTTGTKSAHGSLPDGPSRWLVITLVLPAQYRAKSAVPVTILPSKSFVPSKIGTNGDTRVLSVVLNKVEYK